MIQKTEIKIGELACILVKNNACIDPTAAVIFCHEFGASGTDLVSLADVII